MSELILKEKSSGNACLKLSGVTCKISPLELVIYSTMKDGPLEGDDAKLAAMGHRPELQRSHSTWSMLGLAFAVLNSWTALSASLSISLTSGGSTSVIWGRLILDTLREISLTFAFYNIGLVTAGFCNLCIACSLAEFLSAYPTAGGQYHWVAAIAWPSTVPILSWITGWINVAGWVALVATNSLLSSQLILGVISVLHESYVPQRWHQFLIYIGLTLGSFIVNAFMNSILPVIYRGAFLWSIGGFVVVSITVLACASPHYNSAYFVFCDFVNTTGWPDGVAWLLGLLQGGLGVTAFDAVAHMIEEVPNADIEGPKIMVTCVGIGVATGSIFLMVLLFVAGNMENVATSAAGPLLQILLDATKSNAGGICLLIDGGLPASRFFAKVHPTLKLPLNALMLSVVVVIAFGCIFLGSSSAFNAIISASVVALDLSYGIPIAVNCLQGRRSLPERKWKLPRTVGWIVDIIALSYITLTTVLFVFPPSSTVTGSSMNYCVAAFAVIIMISVFQWIVDGRKNFTGPRVDITLDALDAPMREEIDPSKHEKELASQT
ncbi:Amino acid/polyamine transporter I [Penicillium paradoxum]|uniref:Amino acid/polyamine transporter I n=1 Tax=Penicillium paradoxum TaxID=176176 RepID=UPI0025481768|nr:Amino acid/polyamine transporter I [Penicillium paradoxum]KAJ5778816.1 Amino acid/polyamine transporter I [Penicillium paradoxum]